MNKEELKRKSLEYHCQDNKPGKLAIVSTKKVENAEDLGYAYTPGVASPCLEIDRDKSLAYKYTSKGNLVGVVSNGTAVLGLGNIGPLASKPVMEGKCLLFKKFAGIDAFDIEIDAKTPDEIVNIVKSLGPTFGGINLEDIKAPECFEVEQRLIEEMDIPVFHDDQHGTAIIAAAGILNTLEITGKKLDEIKVVYCGGGAASIAIANFLTKLGIKKSNSIMTDIKGVIYKGRKEEMNPFKDSYAIESDKRTLAEAMNGCDVFIGCSAAGVLSSEMVKTMAKDPVIFAMANPVPEIFPDEVKKVRSDAIVATGRTDFPNQVNNVLGFPFIFRGALDVQAKRINDEMKLAASKALAKLAHEPITDQVREAYDNQDFSFGRDYIIPKPFDKRVLTYLAPAVAKAAMDSGVARKPIKDFDQYRSDLEKFLL